ncbi:MAG: FAD-binding oxidoreductase [Acidobacteria bacterium]|nr:MAG: FAD-binding oxidoreductase [Acidobacteriota bacterium]
MTTAVVVGAGIVGAACAEALASGGARVTVVEAGAVASGATAAPMGHVVVMDDSEPQLALTALGRRLWEERAAGFPADVEDDPCGTLWVAADEEEMASVRRKAEVLSARGLGAEVLDERQLAEAEPSLRPGLAGGLLVPRDRVLYPPNAARALLSEALRLGATVREGTAATAVAPRRVTCGEETLAADLVVLAAGGRSPDLLPSLPIAPRKGHLVVTERVPGFVRHQLVELGYLKSAHTMTAESVAFNVQPRKTGQLLVGSSRELVGWDASVNRPLLSRMLRRASEYLPGLGRIPAIRSWIGFRPATPDKLPLVGWWEEGLLVAAGHEGLGITTAPATGILVADLALGRAPSLDPAPFDPRRRMPAHG